jgi:hypothetical protein
MTQAQKNLGDILITEGVLSHEDLDEVLEKSRTRNLSLEETLFKLGYLSRDTLGAFLAKLHNCQFIDLYSCNVDDDAVGMIPADKALELQALPYGLDKEELLIALAGPFEAAPLEEIVSKLEQVSGKKVRVALCNPDPLKDMLSRYCSPSAGSPQHEYPIQAELPGVTQSLRPDRLTQAKLRAQFEELHKIGQNALLGARSHPFSSAVEGIIKEACSKLEESGKFANSSFMEEAIEMARQAIALFKDADARAVSFEKEWDKLLQGTKKLLSRIGSLEEEGAMESAPSEFGKLIQIRDALRKGVDERDVEKIPSLLDRGTAITDSFRLQEPDDGENREQVITTLAKVRDIVARAQNVGAEEHATKILNEARAFLDEAEDYARNAQWDDANECLVSAESKALEAEKTAIQAEEKKEQLTIKLRESTRAAITLFEKAMAHPFAREVIEELMLVKDGINECKGCFESNELEHGIELAQNIAGHIREEIIPVADLAGQQWNELSQKVDAVSAEIQSIDIPVALRAASDESRLLFQTGRKMVMSLCDRNREKLAEAIATCEGLVEKIRKIATEAGDGLREAENAIGNTVSVLASAASYVIDDHTASLYDEASRTLEQARKSLEDGDADAALKQAWASRTRLETEIIGPQETLRREWTDLSQKAKNISERIQAIDKSRALRVASEKTNLLFRHEHDMLASLAERNREQLASTTAVCDVLVGEINRIVAETQDNLQKAETALTDTKRLSVSAAASGIDEEAAPAYEEALRLLEKAGSFLDNGNYVEALKHVRTARKRLEIDVIMRQDSIRKKWVELIIRSTDLIKRVHAISSTIATYYCPELVNKLHVGVSDIFSALAVRDLEKGETAAAGLGKMLESVDTAIEIAKSEHLRFLFEQLSGIEEAIQKAVEGCAGNYSADMLENAYLEINRIKEQLSKGPEKLDPKLEDKLKSDLAIARTKVWQVEFIRERFDRERGETLSQLKLKMDSARQNIAECEKLDFRTEPSPQLEKAQRLLKQVDNLLMEGNIEECFELVRQSETLTKQVRTTAEEKERQWKELAELLTADKARHLTVLSDPETEKFAREEFGKLAELAATTRTITDVRDLVVLQQHAVNLNQLIDAIAERKEAARKKGSARIEEIILEAKQEIRLAELLGAKDGCPDVLNAARTFTGIAETYLRNSKFVRAKAVAIDACAKAHDASTLAQAVSKHTILLALDYLKIAAARIEQKDFEAAREAIEHGLAIADAALASRGKHRKS